MGKHIKVQDRVSIIFSLENLGRTTRSSKIFWNSGHI